MIDLDNMYTIIGMMMSAFGMDENDAKDCYIEYSERKNTDPDTLARSMMEQWDHWVENPDNIAVINPLDQMVNYMKPYGWVLTRVPKIPNPYLDQLLETAKKPVISELPSVWEKERPTAPGRYWYKGQEYQSGKPGIVSVIQFSDCSPLTVDLGDGENKEVDIETLTGEWASI